MQKTKYIFVTGGVCSSLGKGLTAASIGLLLESKGIRIAMMKLDPYLNVDPGTMSPYQHGEVYVTDDGAETDLDLGHYYRFTNSPLSRSSSATSGQIYNTIIKRERHGDYLGQTVQVIPHITDEIKQRILSCGKENEDVQVVIIEIGGTVGDIESQPFLEALRQLYYEHRGDCLSIHLTYVPYIKAAGEIKTKPTQHSVQAMRAIGLSPDILICRCERPLSDDVKKKLALFCNVPREAVIEEIDVTHSIYEVPIKLHEQNVDSMVCNLLQLPNKPAKLTQWQKMLERVFNPKGTITLGIVGKYVEHKDAYKSVFEALNHGAIDLGYKLEIIPFEADKIIKNDRVDETIGGCDGYLVPGGYGERGWLGKILTAKYARENKIPYLGICLGMQVMSIEFARHVLGITDANSTEMDPATPNPVISLLSEQQDVTELGGTMRLGSYKCKIKHGSRAYKAYKSDLIEERHRHRWEFNNKYRQEMERKGFIVTGELLDGTLCEIVEVKDHPWMVGVQFHPEFKSKPTDPHPLYRDFIAAMIANKKK
jgi:CTP synthase